MTIHLNSTGNKGLGYLCKALPRTKSLRCLDISWTGPYSTKPQMKRRICEALVSLSSLSSLSSSSSLMIVLDSVRAVTDSTFTQVRNQSIAEFNLSNCGLNSEILEIVKQLCKVREDQDMLVVSPLESY